MVDADDMEMTEAFRVLCLPPHATAYEVKRAYRKAALAVHPDKPGGSARLFRRVQAAYEVCLAAVEAFGAAADVAVDHDEPWAKAARAFPGFAALGGLVVRGTEDEPYDWLYFDGEEEEPWDAVLDRVAAARDHFGRPPPTGESPWLEVSGLARLLAAAPVLVVDARTPDEREAAGPLPAPCVVALPAVWLVDEAGAPKLADAPADEPRAARHACDDGVPDYGALEAAVGADATRALRRIFVYEAAHVVVVCQTGAASRRGARRPDCAVVAAALRSSKAVGRGVLVRQLRGGYAQQTFLSRRLLGSYDGVSGLRYRATAKAGVVVRAGVELRTALVAHVPAGSLVVCRAARRGREPEKASTAKGKKRLRVVYPHDGWVTAASLTDEASYARSLAPPDAPPPPPPPPDLRPVANATAGGSFADFLKARNGGLAT